MNKGGKDMNSVEKSLFFFGIYMFILGVILLLIPNFFIGLFGVPETTDVWIRVLGMLVVLVGYYYVRAGRDGEGLVKFFRWTVHTRSSVIVFFIIFVLFDLVKPILILFGVIDLLGAIWTGLALRSAKVR